MVLLVPPVRKASHQDSGLKQEHAGNALVLLQLATVRHALRKVIAKAARMVSFIMEILIQVESDVLQVSWA